MLELYGIPTTKNENTDPIVHQIASKLNVEINEHDIDISHRLSSSFNAGIIAKFSNRRKCEIFKS